MGKEPNFAKEYVEHTCKMNDISGRQRQVLSFIVAKMSVANVATIATARKQKFLTATNMKAGTYSNCITKLKKKGMLKQLGVAEYMVNPVFYARTNWTEVEKISNRYIYSREAKTRIEREVVTTDDKVIKDVIDCETGEVIVEGE